MITFTHLPSKCGDSRAPLGSGRKRNVLPAWQTMIFISYTAAQTTARPRLLSLNLSASVSQSNRSSLKSSFPIGMKRERPSKTPGKFSYHEMEFKECFMDTAAPSGVRFLATRGQCNTSSMVSTREGLDR